MKAHRLLIVVAFVIAVLTSVLSADVKIAVGHHSSEDAAAGFVLPNVPAPSRSDAAQKAALTLVEGRRAVHAPANRKAP